MRRTIKAWIFVLILTIAVTAAGAMTSFAEVPADKTTQLTAIGTKYETYDPNTYLLDDFNDNGLYNIWFGATGIFSYYDPKTTDPANPSPPDGTGYRRTTPLPSCVMENSTVSPFGGTYYSLKLKYNVPFNTDFAGYHSNLQSHNISAYKSLSFYVKGDVGGEFFRVGLKNNSTALYRYDDRINPANSTNYYRNTSAVAITDYLEGGVKNYWQKVNIPLHNFANLDGFTSMNQLVFIFENSAVALNGSPPSGTVYIDKIYFESASIAWVAIDHYGDKLTLNALGGNMGATSGFNGTIMWFDDSPFNPFSSTQYYPYPNGLELTYDVRASGAWSSVFSIFGGGNADDTIGKISNYKTITWIPVAHNFSEFNKLTFLAKAKSYAENPRILKVELVDNAGTKIAAAYSINDVWQQWDIPLDETVWIDSKTRALTVPDKTSIKQLNFVFDGSYIGALRLPLAPSNITYTRTAQGMVIVWQDNSNNETGFRIERYNSSGAFNTKFIVGPNIITYIDTTAPQTEAFTYKVVAFNNHGDSDPANTPPSKVGTVYVDEVQFMQ